jgi:hypothetical protein
LRRYQQRALPFVRRARSLFTRKRTAGVVIVAALALTAGLTLVLATASGPSRSSNGHPFVSKLAAQELAGNRGEPGEEAAGEDPAAAAEQAYEERAYPADEIPFQATLNAQAAWAGVKARGVGKSKNTSGQWTLAGPSTANYPAVLTFSGSDYTASGRVTGLAIDPACSQSKCRAWVAAAGGGIWRTDNALSGSGANWTFVSGSFATNAIGTLLYQNGVLYAGTGEPNASGDSEAGMGLYKSTDGGDTWTHLASHVTALTTPGNGTYTGDAFAGRSISSIAVDPNNSSHLYVSSTRGVRGVSSSTGGATSNPPTPRPPFGLFESTDGGATFNFIWNGNASLRGVNEVRLDPSWNGTTNTTLYAAAFQQGIWRSTNGGTTFTQIKAPLNPLFNTDRAEFAVAHLANGNTRMYVGDGAQGDVFTDDDPPVQIGFAARFYRSDDVATGSPSFTDLTTSLNRDYCTAQCWYDNVVYSPPDKPDVVYLGGSFSYGSYGFSTNGRAWLRSANAGASFTDLTSDATTNPTPAGNCCQPNPIAPNGMHPDQHAIVEIPGTDSAIFGSDGGLMRSSGQFADISSQCDSRPLGPASMARCKQLLSAVPTYLYNLNKGLSTLQFQSLSVAADNFKHLQGGTQDNGTFETYGSAVTWPQIIYGDGGQSGFNAANSSLRFNSFFGQFHDANFENGDPTKWVIISGDIAASPESGLFYVPIIADPNPAAAGSIFEGSQSVWRTQDWGGDPAYLEANCPEFTTPGTDTDCGDFVQIGPTDATDLTASAADYRGTTRAGGNVARIARAAGNTGTMWVATTTGRVFLSQNANAAAGSVTYTRLDTLPSATADPNRFVSGIAIDPSNPNHAWVSYSGYNFNTPSLPGHIFSVTYNPATNDATWTSLDGTGTTAFPDFPATDVAFDSVTGDLYASNDFGVMRLASGSSAWALAGVGMPNAEVAGLTIVPGARKLYAATHGRSAWQLTLP